MSEPMYDLVAGNWSSTRAAAVEGRQLYVLDADQHVYPVDPLTGTYGDSLGRFSGDHLVVVDGTPHVFDRPVAVLGGTIFHADASTHHLIGHRDQLFAWDTDNALYRVDPSTGEATALLNNWPHVSGVATAIGRLYAVEGGILYEVDPMTGSCTVIADRMRTRTLIGVGSSIYSFEDSGDLYRIGVG